MSEVWERGEDTGEALAQAAQEILERMFFLTVDEVEEPPEGVSPERGLASGISFRGVHSGRLHLVVSHSCAGELAANFTGLADGRQLHRARVAEVLCEFTNMVCGATLSRLAPHAVFNLDAPGMLETAPVEAGAALKRRLKCGDEWINLYWRWEKTA
jgi:hypothetical protein